MWAYLGPTERVLFKSNAGVMWGSQVTDGVLYVTTRRLVFVVRGDLAVVDVAVSSDVPVVVGRTTWMNGFVQVGDLELVMPSREIPALEWVIQRMRGRTAGPIDGAAFAAARSGAVGRRQPAAATQAMPGGEDGDAARPRRGTGLWLGAGLLSCAR